MNQVFHIFISFVTILNLFIIPLASMSSFLILTIKSFVAKIFFPNLKDQSNVLFFQSKNYFIR
jgi:hypothetical protein